MVRIQNRKIYWRNLLMTSICSKVSCTASRCCAPQGTYADQNCAPNSPARNRPISVCDQALRDHGSVVESTLKFTPSKRLCTNFLKFHGKSLCASINGASRNKRWIASNRSWNKPENLHIFSYIFLFWTNSFLIQIYHILLYNIKLRIFF